MSKNKLNPGSDWWGISDLRLEEVQLIPKTLPSLAEGVVLVKEYCNSGVPLLTSTITSSDAKSIVVLVTEDRNNHKPIAKLIYKLDGYKRKNTHGKFLDMLVGDDVALGIDTLKSVFSQTDCEVDRRLDKIRKDPDLEHRAESLLSGTLVEMKDNNDLVLMKSILEPLDERRITLTTYVAVQLLGETVVQYQPIVTSTFKADDEESIVGYVLTFELPEPIRLLAHKVQRVARYKLINNENYLKFIGDHPDE